MRKYYARTISRAATGPYVAALRPDIGGVCSPGPATLLNVCNRWTPLPQRHGVEECLRDEALLERVHQVLGVDCRQGNS